MPGEIKMFHLRKTSEEIPGPRRAGEEFGIGGKESGKDVSLYGMLRREERFGGKGCGGGDEGL